MMTGNDPRDLLSPLFEKAQAAEEFEFCCTILRVRGIEGPGWDPLSESYATISQLLGTINAPINDLFRLRLTLFLYCHATEIDDLYNIIANLIRISGGTGYRHSMTPFSSQQHSSNKTAKYPHSKTERIAEWAKEAGFSKLGEAMQFFLVKEVRNAFLHSDYIITKDSFNIKNGEGVPIEGIITKSIPLGWLTPKLELGINFTLVLLELLQAYIASYKEEKVVDARVLHDGSSEKMKLTVHPQYGLSGFRSLTEEEREQIA